MKWRELSERQIRKAQAEGQLDNLRGAGMPLQSDGASSSANAVGFRIMAEAGALPPEISLKKECDAKRAELAALTDPAARKEAMAALATLEMRYAMAVEARRKYFGSD